MDITLKDVRLARKRAYDRVDYWLHKNWSTSMKELGVRIPTIPKDLRPNEYEAWYNYFYNMRGNSRDSVIGNQLDYGWSPPDRIAPTPVDPLPILYERLDGINPMATSYVRFKIEGLANLIHLDMDTKQTPESVISGVIHENWDIWQDIEQAAYYMKSNYYGGLELLDRALSKLFSLFGFTYMKFNATIMHSAPGFFHMPVDKDYDVEEVVLPLSQVSRLMRDNLNED